MRGAVYVNGTITPADRAVVPVYDHGFVYGEGVYEVLRTYNRVPFLYDRHMARLRQSAERLTLDVPFDDATLLQWIDRTAAVADVNEAYIRVLLTRGVGDLTYDLSATPTPTVVIIVKPFEPLPAQHYIDGMRLALVDTLRNHPRSVNPLIKANNLLNNALAIRAAQRVGGEEALMCNYRGEITECAMSNFFLVRDGAVLTPPSDAGMLEGVTRAFVFELGRDLGIDVREQTLLPTDLDGADEMFITSTTRGLSPVVRVDDRVVGSGKPGAITKRLLDRYEARAQEMTMPTPPSVGTRR
jgi:branched-chain amino acid aminotransferase